MGDNLNRNVCVVTLEIRLITDSTGKCQAQAKLNHKCKSQNDAIELIQEFVANATRKRVEAWLRYSIYTLIDLIKNIHVSLKNHKKHVTSIPRCNISKIKVEEECILFLTSAIHPMKWDLWKGFTNESWTII